MRYGPANRTSNVGTKKRKRQADAVLPPFHGRVRFRAKYNFRKIIRSVAPVPVSTGRSGDKGCWQAVTNESVLQKPRTLARARPDGRAPLQYVPGPAGEGPGAQLQRFHQEGRRRRRRG